MPSTSIKREYFIPVPLHELQTTLVDKVRLQRGDAVAKEFFNLCSLLHAVYHHRAQEIEMRMKADFHSIVPKNSRQRLASCGHRDQQDGVDEVRQRFLKDYCRLAEKGNYAILTKEDWETAQQQNFSFQMDIDIGWNKLDSKSLSTLLNARTDIKSSAYAYADRVLIFHRGMAQESLEARFIQEKVDLLLSYIRSAVTGVFSQGKTSTADATKTTAGEGKDESDCQVMQRESLIHVLPTVSAIIGSLVKKTTIREPMMEEVVLLYFDSSVNPCELNIKAFRHIPMADMEILFPHKKVTTPPTTVLKLFFAFVATIVSILVKLRKTISDSHLMMVVVGCGLLVVKGALQIQGAIKQQQFKDHATMTQCLYTNSSTSGFGVVHSLIISMEEQEVKEAMLGYWALLSCSEGLTIKQIDNECEQLLLSEFGVQTDFEVEDACAKLRGDGLVQEAKDRFTAIATKDACLKLFGLWKGFFFEDGGDGSEVPAPKSGCGSFFLE